MLGESKGYGDLGDGMHPNGIGDVGIIGNCEENIEDDDGGGIGRGRGGGICCCGGGAELFHRGEINSECRESCLGSESAEIEP